MAIKTWGEVVVLINDYKRQGYIAKARELELEYEWLLMKEKQELRQRINEWHDV